MFPPRSLDLQAWRYWQACYREVWKGGSWNEQAILQVCLGVGQTEGGAWTWHHHWYCFVEFWDHQPVSPRMTLLRRQPTSPPRSSSWTTRVRSEMAMPLFWTATPPTLLLSLLRYWPRLTGDLARSLRKSPSSWRMVMQGLLRWFPPSPWWWRLSPSIPPLGRFAVRDMRQTVAVGVIKNVKTVFDAVIKVVL